MIQSELDTKQRVSLSFLLTSNIRYLLIGSHFLRRIKILNLVVFACCCYRGLIFSVSMGEIVVLSSDDGTETNEETLVNRGKSSEVVRWEKYLPKTVLRVLLVESDDSTRQIITALLRKCSYKGRFIISSFPFLCNFGILQFPFLYLIFEL